MKRLMTGTLALLATFTLAACGSATVESGSEVSPDATVAPLERGDGDLLSSSESETSEERSSKESTEASTSKSEPAPEDRGAQEVEQAPTPQVDTSNAGFLDAVAGGGVDITGVENQLVSAAHTACNPDDDVTVLAVAGQLIEQERTDKDVEEVVALINEQAQAAYC
ncbi:hypothetical protein [Corynebacterium sp.]|uniref:hypothetical protein n=1 Tax=Corynebacterium sp. TaxID=1720 RepID=UPI00264847F1|nr:hypothetical protein [Corynebacterium sp.]MDN6135989.1 hypothetical protein [Corynebacterium sp.]MDN6737059.1 hypothetical protein [Corynebacterium sp.]